MDSALFHEGQKPIQEEAALEQPSLKRSEILEGRVLEPVDLQIPRP